MGWLNVSLLTLFVVWKLARKLPVFLNRHSWWHRCLLCLCRTIHKLLYQYTLDSAVRENYPNCLASITCWWYMTLLQVNLYFYSIAARRGSYIMWLLSFCCAMKLRIRHASVTKVLTLEDGRSYTIGQLKDIIKSQLSHALGLAWVIWRVLKRQRVDW